MPTTAMKGQKKKTKTSSSSSSANPTTDSTSPKREQNKKKEESTNNSVKPIEEVLTVEERLKRESFFLITHDDIPYEEDLLRDQYNIKSWLRYLYHKQNANRESKIFIYERALKVFPGSYKLWKQYLDLRLSVLLEDIPNKDGSWPKKKKGYNKHAADVTPKRRKLDLSNKEWERVNFCFEKSLILLNKMPVIWIMYLNFLMYQCEPTKTRQTFDRALKSLPITQHERIWTHYLEFAKKIGGETAVKIWRRYLKLDARAAEDYIDVLLNLSPPRYAEAARYLAAIVEDPRFVSSRGKSHYQLWTELCDIVCDHPEDIEQHVTSADAAAIVSPGSLRLGKVEKLDVDRILRSGITRFTDQVGKLWVALARWWVSRGEFDKVRDVFEEGIRKVMTVRDFSMIFDAYAEFEENVISSKMEMMANRESSKNNNDEDEEEEEYDDIDLDLRLAQFEQLMDRRPFLVNDVLLRQNPHNVSEWENRVQLHKERNNKEGIIDTYTKACSTIAPRKAHGKFNMLWVHFAQWYEEENDLESARSVYKKAVKVPFKRVDELAEVWCQWAEMEIRHDNYEQALAVMGQATAPPPGKQLNIKYQDESLPPQTRLFKSLKLWTFYVDLEESVGTVESTKAIYDRIMELKIATPQVIINCASFLEDNKYFEESYKAYERGIEMFGYPIAFDIWNLYLSKFIARYGGQKLERTRDLFEHALDKCPPKLSKPLYLMYAKLEEDFGLAKHAMKIYHRATMNVADEDKFELFTIYISKATSFFGLTSTREIYEKAIETLPDKEARIMALRFVDLEVRLGEVDRARAILAYASQFSDPRLDPDFWKRWHEFEVKHGNEDTFKEMLRIKRSVQAKFNTDVSFISNQILAARQNGASKESAAAAGEELPISDTMEALEREYEAEEQQLQKNVSNEPRVVGFVKSKAGGLPGADNENIEHIKQNAATTAINPDEIELDSNDEDSDVDNVEFDDHKQGSSKDVPVTTKSIPESLFNGMKEETMQEENEEMLGAKERFKRKR